MISGLGNFLNNYIRLIVFGVLLLFSFPMFIFTGVAGQCDYPDDIASDGSLCGNRASSVKPGGRNPGIDTLLWVGFIGGGIFIAFKMLNSSGEFTSRSSTPSFNTGRSNSGLKTKSNPTCAVKKNIFKTAVATKSSTEEVIRRDFGYALDHVILPIFQSIVEETANSGHNEHDAAIVFMTVQMNALYPGSDLSRNFVDMHSHNLLRVLPKATDDQAGYINALNEIRVNHNLPIIS